MLEKISAVDIYYWLHVCTWLVRSKWETQSAVTDPWYSETLWRTDSNSLALWGRCVCIQVIAMVTYGYRIQFWHFPKKFKKGKPVVARCRGGGRWRGRAQRIFRAVKILCIKYSGGYMSLYIYIVYRMYNTKNRSWYKLVTVGDYVMSM